MIYGNGQDLWERIPVPLGRAGNPYGERHVSLGF